MWRQQHRSRAADAAWRRGELGPGIFLIALVLSMAISTPSRAQADCEVVMGEAEAHYRTGAFSDAISVLAPCVRSFPAGSDDDVAAHRLLALAFLRNGDLDDARIVLVELFGRQPGYEADPVSDPPAYVSLVNLVRSETGLRQSSPGGGAAAPPRTWLRSPRTWLMIGGGAAVAAALVVLGTTGGGNGGNGGGGSDLLPMPLPFP